MGNSEFDVAFDLEAIPLALRERMVAAAPMLLGRNAEYDNMFFHDKVGLCDRGPIVDGASSRLNVQLIECSVLHSPAYVYPGSSELILKLLCVTCMPLLFSYRRL